MIYIPIPQAERLLVTGAGGGLGRAVVALARAQGWRTTGLYRSPPNWSGPADRVVLGDVTTIDWNSLVEGHELVAHLAAFVHRLPRDGNEVRHMRAVNVEATAQLARACLAHDAKLVFASSVAVFGSTGDRCIGDGRPPAPTTENGRTKRQAEQVLESNGAIGLRFTALRLPLLYGPNGRGNMERMLRAIDRHHYWPVGPGTVVKNCLYFDDVARAIFLSRAPAVDAKCLILAEPEPPTLREIHETAYRALGRRIPPEMPGWCVRGMARAVDVCLSVLGREPSLVHQVETLTRPAHFDGSRFAALTGFHPTVRLQEGLERTVRAIREAQ